VLQGNSVSEACSMKYGAYCKNISMRETLSASGGPVAIWRGSGSQCRILHTEPRKVPQLKDKEDTDNDDRKKTQKGNIMFSKTCMD